MHLLLSTTMKWFQLHPLEEVQIWAEITWTVSLNFAWLAAVTVQQDYALLATQAILLTAIPTPA